MSYYSTQARLEAKASAARVLLFGDKDRDGSIDPTTLNQALVWARNQILLYCARRYGAIAYAWTTATVPGVLLDISDDLALWYLSAGNPGVPPGLEQNKDMAMEQLKEIQSRKSDLFDTSGNIVGEVSGLDDLVVSSDSDLNAYNRDFPLNDDRTIDYDGDPETSW